MENIIYGPFRDRIKKYECWRNLVYWDCAENLTGGWGHNFTANWMSEEFINKFGTRSISKPITKTMGEYLLTEDLINVIHDLKFIFGFDKMLSWPDGMLCCMADMMFNMGLTRFKKFKNMIAAVYREDWRNVIYEIRDSLYYDQITKAVNKLKDKGIENTFHRANDNIDLIIECIDI